MRISKPCAFGLRPAPFSPWKIAMIGVPDIAVSLDWKRAGKTGNPKGTIIFIQEKRGTPGNVKASGKQPLRIEHIFFLNDLTR